MTRCSAIKPDGERCRGIAGRNSEWCPAHDPARADARKRNASKAARSKPNRELVDIKTRLRELADDVLAGRVDRGDAAVAGQLLNTVIRALALETKVREQEEVLERLEVLEARHQQGGSRQWR